MIRLCACLDCPPRPQYRLCTHEQDVRLGVGPEGLDPAEDYPEECLWVELQLSHRSRTFLEDHKVSEGPLNEILEQAIKAGFKLAVKIEELSRKK